MPLYHIALRLLCQQRNSESRSQCKAKAYSAASAKSQLAATSIRRRDPREDDVQIEILFCGICHSDLHQVRNEWSGMPTVYPCVPGHEIVGRVTKVGSTVTKFKPGDLAAVGCLVGLMLVIPFRSLSRVYKRGYFTV